MIINYFRGVIYMKNIMWNRVKVTHKYYNNGHSIYGEIVGIWEKGTMFLNEKAYKVKFNIFQSGMFTGKDFKLIK
jgi:hypothetical protein